MNELVSVLINGVMTGGAMYFIWDLECRALEAGINGTQFTYVIAGIALLGGVTVAPLLDYFRKKGNISE